MTGVPPEGPVPPPERGGGSVILGSVVGVLFFAAIIGLTTLLASWPGDGWLPTVAVLAYLVASIVLTARRRTARFGTGLLIAIGVSVLIGAGVCVALIAGTGQGQL